MAYNLLAPIHLINAQSMGSNITSNPVEIKLQDNVGVQLNWTGTPTGSFSVQVSQDYVQDNQGNVKNPGNWISLALSPGITAAGTPDTAYIDLNQLSAPWVRIFYSRSSGSGTLDAFITAKGV